MVLQKTLYSTEYIIVSKSTLLIFDRMQYEAIREVLSCMQTTPITI